MSIIIKGSLPDDNNFNCTCTLQKIMVLQKCAHLLSNSE